MALLLAQLAWSLWNRPAVAAGVLIPSQPAGARVYLIVSDFALSLNSSESGIHERLVGFTPGPVALDPKRDLPATVRLQLWGYQPRTAFLDKSWQPRVLVLTPRWGVLSGLLAGLRRWPFAALLALYALGQGLSGWRSWRRRSQQRARWRRQAQPQPGDTIHGYQLDARLGRGGSGEVFRARRQDGGRELALKTVRLNPQSSIQLLQEARICKELNHPNLVPVLDWGECDGLSYLVMELVDGQDLEHILGQPRALSEVAGWLGQLAAAVSELHARGIVHRDLKPGNVMLSSSGRLLVMDLGIARASGESEGERQGTPGYVSPEVLAGQAASPASDVYAVGAILYYALAGHPPFQGEPLQVLRKQSLGDFVGLGQHRPDLPPPLIHLVEGCLAADPLKRPGLEELQQGFHTLATN